MKENFDINDNLPIIVGVGQVVKQWNGLELNEAPNPVDIIKEAIEVALCDASDVGLKEEIDYAAIIRTFPDSLPMPYNPFGKIINLPAAVLQGLKIKPKNVLYTSAGGEQPQFQVSSISEKLYNSEIEFAIIAGGEVNGALKRAVKLGAKLDWASNEDFSITDNGPKTDFITEYELKNGLGLPPQTYASMEDGLRARLKMSVADYAEYTSKILSNLSEVASKNEYAQFPKHLPSSFLSIPSRSNYRLYNNYLKWSMAQDAVNQSAAIIITTVRKAKKLSIPQEKWVYLHGYSNIEDTFVTHRPDISKSDAISLVINKALKTSKLNSTDIDYKEIYSCFPIVLILAAEVLGVDPTQECLTVTGGLPFFGGPGNNYSSHGIAALVESLRKDRGAYGLVLANGGFMSKESSGIYSTKAPDDWSVIDNKDDQRFVDNRPSVNLLNEDCKAEIEGFCLKYDRDIPQSGYVIAKNDKGRILAKIKTNNHKMLKFLSGDIDVVGKTAKFSYEAGYNYIVDLNL